MEKTGQILSQTVQQRRRSRNAPNDTLAVDHESNAVLREAKQGLSNTVSFARIALFVAEDWILETKVRLDC